MVVLKSARRHLHYDRAAPLEAHDLLGRHRAVTDHNTPAALDVDRGHVELLAHAMVAITWGSG